MTKAEMAALTDTSYPGQEFFHRLNPNIKRAEENWRCNVSSKFDNAHLIEQESGAHRADSKLTSALPVPGHKAGGREKEFSEEETWKR